MARKLFSIQILFALLIPTFGGGRAQNTPSEKATVYIYANQHARMMKRAAAPVLIDDREVAVLDGSRFFVVHLEPGMHTFRSKNKRNGGAEIDVKANETYYLRLEWEHTGYFLKFSGLRLMPKENGAYDVKQAKPINRKDIKDTSIVDMNFIEQ